MFSRLITSPPRVGGSGLRGSPLSLQHLDHVFRALADDPEEDPQPGDEQDQVDQAKKAERGPDLAGGDDRRNTCLLYTSDAADDLLCVDLGGRRIIKKKK